jgi:hypothetical protein
MIARRVPVTRQALLGIGSILALVLGIVLIVVAPPTYGVVVLALSPVLAAYAVQV